MQNNPELILRPERRRSILFATACAAFTAAGVFMITEGEAVGWLAVAFFGFGTVAFLSELLPNTVYLKLDADGFTLRSLFGSTSYRWSDVSMFGVGQLGRNRAVLIKLSPEYGKYGRVRRFNSTVFGAEAAISGTYGMTPEELAILLTEWKTRHTAANSLKTVDPV